MNDLTNMMGNLGGVTGEALGSSEFGPLGGIAGKYLGEQAGSELGGRIEKASGAITDMLSEVSGHISHQQGQEQQGPTTFLETAVNIAGSVLSMADKVMGSQEAPGGGSNERMTNPASNVTDAIKNGLEVVNTVIGSLKGLGEEGPTAPGGEAVSPTSGLPGQNGPSQGLGL